MSTDADRRYSELLQKVIGLAGDDWRVVHELDEAVGERLGEHEDRGCSPRIIDAERRIGHIELRLERLARAVLGEADL